MMLTTRGRYAVMAMVDLAGQCDQQKPVSLADIAARQEIALNYLEQIFSKLRKKGLVLSVRGPGGGYVLAENPDIIRIADIITAVDEPIAITRCKSHKQGCRQDKAKCLTHDLWEGLGNHIHAYLQSITLTDVWHRNTPAKIALFSAFASQEAEAQHVSA